METMGRKTSDIDHEGVLHRPKQFDERDRPSNSVWASDELNDLKAKLKIADTMDPSLTKHWCIYKVLPKIRKLNEEAYTPHVVSIGPYHHGDGILESMQELKVWYLNRFLQRTPEKSLEDYFKALKDDEEKIRHCYSDTIHMKSHEFVSMILIDACFIIEFFLVSVGSGDHLVQKLWQKSFVPIDLILLENQLPFFVLTHLFDDLAFPNGFVFKGKRSSFVELTFDVFENFFLEQIYPNEETHNRFRNRFNPVKNLKEALHLCDVLRTFFLPPKQPHTTKNISHSVIQLHEAGMAFQADKESFLTKVRTFFLPRDPQPRQPDTAMNCSHSISQLHEAGMEIQVDKESFATELKYSKEVLTIPGIVVNGITETMLRNVIAFEQCYCYPLPGYVSEYASLLDDLINNGKDVEILIGKKIMVNLLGDNDEVASMVNKLCKSAVIIENNKDYISLCRELDKFCENPYHKYKAIFVREYWSTPWKIASVIAATLLLLLTFIQTISSVI